jgi:hypothetical protein
MSKMRVLVACEYSGRVREAFRANGHDAWSCDLLESEDNSPFHIVGDAVEVANRREWDMLIGHPPCTYLANSGVQHLSKDPTRWAKMEDGAAFFMALWSLPIPRICLENPVMHGHARALIGGMRPFQVIQPYMFGHMESKATGLYLKGLMPLRPTSDLKAETMALPSNQRQRLHYLPPGPNRWKERSRTYPGIAAAMAAQWGSATPAHTPTGLARPCANPPGAGATIRKNNNNGV